MGSELLPCPFCGGQNVDANHNLRNHHEEIFCDDCSATVSSEGNHSDAVALWNRRADREAEAGAVKPLEWEQPTFGQDEYKHVAQAHGCDFYYEIERRGNDRKPFTVSRSRDINCFAWAATIEEAMAAAQTDYEQRILSALASPPAPHVAEIPEGWVLVPIKPTETMLDMGACYEDQDHQIVEEGAIAGDIWRAMLAAAPHHKQEGGNT